MKQNQKLILIVIIGIAVTLLIGTSYALLKSTSIGTNTYTMNVGTLEINFIDSKTNTLNLTNAYPMTDEEGLNQEDVLSFTIENQGDFDALYNVYIEETSTTPEFKTVIRYVSSKDLGVTYESPKTLSENKYIEQNGILGIGEEITYKVKMWLAAVADNTYMGATFSAKIVVEALQKRNVVTFDANGGTVPIERMNVEYGEPYGELPIPVRDGYTFMGWNGKNLLNYFNISYEASLYDIVVNNNGYIEDNSPSTDSRTWNYDSSNWQNIYNPGQYVVTLYFSNMSSSSYSGMNIFFQGAHSLGTTSISNKKVVSKVFGVSQYRNVGIHVKAYDGIYRIQLEEGTEATEYEPYYITSDTKVVQNHDHILKAIWQENS